MGARVCSEKMHRGKKAATKTGTQMVVVAQGDKSERAGLMALLDDR